MLSCFVYNSRTFTGEQLIQPFLDEITNMEEDPRYENENTVSYTFCSHFPGLSSYWELDMESSSFVSKEKKNILGDGTREKLDEGTEVFVDIPKDKAIELARIDIRPIFMKLH